MLRAGDRSEPPIAASREPEPARALFPGDRRRGVGPRSARAARLPIATSQIEVTDIATDPLWSGFRTFALPIGLRACWSSPITSGDGRVIGTFAFYYRTPRGPGAVERQIVATCLHHCAIAIEHEEARTRIHELAFRDPLTGLPNRLSFRKKMLEALNAPPAARGAIAIHYIDLDGFKDVNDTLGHSIGDELLRSVTKRLVACCQSGSMAGSMANAVIARLGGDEFAILQNPIEDQAEIGALAARVIAVFDEPFYVDSDKIRISASAGIARAPDDGEDPEELLRKADLALYRAKAEGRRRFQLFTPEMDLQLQIRRSLESDLRTAVDISGFELAFQPIINLASGDVTSVEALVRWHRPRYGMVSPDAFIPIAEETGLIEDIGDWVLNEACAHAVRWLPGTTVAINLSLRQLRNSGFVFNVIRTLNRTGLSPVRLELEITESVLLSNQPNVRAALAELDAIGVQFALDDFGTGYSSLSYLRSFPFSKIKIDKSFVDDLGSKADSSAIIRAVTGLARDLGIKTTAEGVETREQLELLRAEGCAEAQGYYISKPLSAAKIAEFLADRPALSAAG